MVGMGLLVFIGGFCFQSLYVPDDGKPLTYLHGVYVTYCLIFMEHLLEWPNHWLLQVFYVVLPPLGLAVILDGIVRFSYHILRRDETSPEWTRAMAHTMQDHVILFGLGKLGLRILQELLRLDEQVVVVERDTKCPNLAYARKHGVPVRIGMGREEDILLDLNIKSAKSVILATNDDLMNLEIAIDARAVRPGIRVVLRVFDQELADKIKNTLDLKLAFSTWELSAPVFAMASADRTIMNAFYVGKELMVVAKIRIAPDSVLAGKQVADLRTEHRALVLAVRSRRRPPPDPGLQLRTARRRRGHPPVLVRGTGLDPRPKRRSPTVRRTDAATTASQRAGQLKRSQLRVSRSWRPEARLMLRATALRKTVS